MQRERETRLASAATEPTHDRLSIYLSSQTMRDETMEEQRQTHRVATAAQQHRRRRRTGKRPRPSSSSSSSPLPTAAILSALILQTPPASNALLPLSSSTAGGYLTSPPSRNYVAWTSNPLLPSSARPLDALPEMEPTPHNLNLPSNGGTCGGVDGLERDYNTPMSRMQSLLPLNVQAVYTSGEEIQVKMSLFGIDAGGHFEFSLCPVEYPNVPTEECFEQWPVEFVRDDYYGGVVDEKFPNRAYVPLVGAFGSTSDGDGGVSPIEDSRVSPGGGSMMEFSYTLKLPEDAELWSVDEDVLEGMSVMFDNVPALVQEGARVTVQGGTTTERGASMAETYFMTYQAPSSSNRHDKTSRTQVLREGNQRHRNAQQQPQSNNHIEAQLNDVAANLATTNEHSAGTLYYAQQVDSVNTPSMVETVPIASMVTDGNGTTTITSLDGGVTVISGGPKIPASTTVTWGDKAIYGEGSGYTPLPTSPPKEEEIMPQFDLSTEGINPSNHLEGATFPSDPVPISQAFQVDADSPPSSTKYVLLRWHYVTSRDCYPPGYDTYPWPESWGNWIQPWSGQCTEGQAHEQYWNCAEIQILPPLQPTPSPIVEPSEISLMFNNQVPNAVSDIVLIGKEELAHLNVLYNDIDPDGDKLFVESVSEPIHGKAGILEGGLELIYVPVGNFTGLDSFEYTACDPLNLCDTARVDVMVGPIIDLIFTKDDHASTISTTPVAIDVTRNDFVRVDQPLVVTKVRGGRHGACVVKDNGLLEYTASNGYQGQDRCEYTACLKYNTNICDEGWLLIKILLPLSEEIESLSANSDSGILALDDAIITDSRDPPVKVDVLANDEVTGNESPIVSKVSGATHGQCEVTDDNQVLYTPVADFVGWDRCSYTACVGQDVCDEGRIKIQVMILPQDKPVKLEYDVIAMTDKVIADSGKPVVIDAIANDLTLSDKPMLLSGAGGALHGDCSVTVDNQVEYVSESSYEGWDRCTYTVCVGDSCNDGQIGIKVMATATPVNEITPSGKQKPTNPPTEFDVVVLSANMDPVAKFDSVSIVQDKVAYINVLANDSDPDGNVLVIDSVTSPQSGSVEVVFGRVVYTPIAGFTGVDCE
eukprot:scaffold1539_cov191-Alexandrium_tamarense.AAC.3